MIGTTLSHYTIDALLGEGGMGRVYRARDTMLDRTVAIKVLSAAADPDARRRLLREARAASALNHPNIVTIHAVEAQDGVDFIVMEHATGEPLSRAIPPEGLPIDRALDCARQIASALAAAHAAGIVHRDIKPANVTVAPDGRVKVLDFGIARRTALPEDAETGRMTADATIAPTGVIIGTPGYLSPEQVTGRPAGPASDVFALGAVLFEMLTGARAFGGDTVWSTMDATLRRDPPSVDTVRRGVPVSLARVVARALAKDPAGRYPSGRELLNDLEAVAAERAAPARPASRWRVRAAFAASVAVTLLLGGALLWLHVRDARVRWARDTALPEIGRLADAGNTVAAYRLARRAIAAAPDDPQVSEVWADIAHQFPLTSDPGGATVEFKGYADTGNDWIPVGRTPITAPLPVGLLRWRVTKDGYEPLEAAPTAPPFDFHLARAGTSPPGMVLVPAGAFDLESQRRNVDLPDYFIDRFEVTNREYEAFIDAGGYRTRQYWTQPFEKNGRTLNWDQAMAEFRDATGRPGPSTWALGTYPDGQDDWPVSGVSWYEAAAYAAWTGERLPTVYHWYRASGAFGIFSDILRFSNFGEKGTVRVGSEGGLGPYGTYDMAGNVKEWCWNEAAAGRRYVLGGAFNDANYQFRDEDAQPPFERAAGYGFRCIRQDAPAAAPRLAPIVTLERDPATLKPVGDDVYAAYRRLYDYDPTPLDSRVESEDDSNPNWRRQRVSFRAAYGDERVPAYVFLPTSSPPPYQAVIFFPGSDAEMLRSSRHPWLQWVEFLVRSGRVVVYPVYQQTYERLRKPSGPNFTRRIMIQRAQDVRRTVDYLASRPDIDRSRIAFYGLSLGAQLTPVFLAVEPRLRTGVLLSGGFETWNIPPECDPVNFAPHVTQPVLMVNGREDFDLPYETAQIPLFHALGTSPAEKRHVVFEGGHIPSHPLEVYKAILDWLDQHLGPVGAATPPAR